MTTTLLITLLGINITAAGDLIVCDSKKVRHVEE